ncbi:MULTISPECIES: endolytic transglycosylase MltG [unclassified Streptomyces]|uniref:endolytic transglycosylase MltG n=1 Tax=unclassified Streptomyces TaxID=2593676 RepID=UPI00187513E0|nr:MULTISPECIES: endolytic transglycosylase MltG [unclassified Streptomyces]
MTEYGRGPGPAPWHPEDPLFGDGGWEGQQAPLGHQPAYGGHQQQYPQSQQQAAYNGWTGGDQQPGYGRQPQHDQPQYDQQQYDQYGQPVYPQYDQQQYADPNQPQSYHQGGWDGTGTHAHVPYAADPGDPYGQQPAAYGAEQPDFYGTPDAYPPPEPPARRRDPDPEPEPEPLGSILPEPDDALADEATVAETSPEERGRRAGKGGKGGKGDSGKKKRRNGAACLVVVLVFGGGIAGVAYFGMQFYQDRYGASPDYAGNGTDETVSVTIPKGAGGAAIGRALKAAGVVKSVDAFVSAYTQNAKSGSIQAGSYVLNKEMSAQAAVAMMLDPKSQNNLIIAEGTRNVAVYAQIDKRLDLSEGTTAGVAKAKYKDLGLPDWALNHPNVKDPLEGFLYPSRYAVAKADKPETLLKEMVTRANQKYEQLGLEKQAEKLGLDGPWQLLTVASLAQAEGTSHDDFRKMAEVVYNRLKPGNPQTYGSLEFDSTYNYIKNQSKIDLTIAELKRFNNPYNTYYVKGLPPGPIDNPGDEALRGALNPTDDGWYYFISLDGKTSRFTKTLAEHEELVAEFNESRKGS